MEAVDDPTRSLDRVTAVGARVDVVPVVNDDYFSGPGVRDHLRGHALGGPPAEPIPIPGHPAPANKPVFRTGDSSQHGNAAPARVRPKERARPAARERLHTIGGGAQ